MTSSTTFTICDTVFKLHVEDAQLIPIPDNIIFTNPLQSYIKYIKYILICNGQIYSIRYDDAILISWFDVLDKSVDISVENIMNTINNDLLPKFTVAYKLKDVDDNRSEKIYDERDVYTGVFEDVNIFAEKMKQIKSEEEMLQLLYEYPIIAKMHFTPTPIGISPKITNMNTNCVLQFIKYQLTDTQLNIGVTVEQYVNKFTLKQNLATPV